MPGTDTWLSDWACTHTYICADNTLRWCGDTHRWHMRGRVHMQGEMIQMIHVNVDTGVDAGGGDVDIHVDTEMQVDLQLWSVSVVLQGPPGGSSVPDSRHSCDPEHTLLPSALAASGHHLCNVKAQPVVLTQASVQWSSPSLWLLQCVCRERGSQAF